MSFIRKRDEMQVVENSRSKFVFLGHYVSIDHFLRTLTGPYTAIRLLPYQLQKKILYRLQPHKYLSFPDITSVDGEEVTGESIMIPFIPEAIVTLGEEAVLQKVVSGAKLARKLGARIVGLAGFTSIVGNEGEELAEQVDIAVTSGNTLTAVLALEGLRAAANMMDIPFRSATAAIIGATGDIGTACSRALCREVKELRIVARNQDRLLEFAQELKKQASPNTTILAKKYTKEAIQGADLVLTAASAITTLIDPLHVKTGAIICDVAIPHNVGTELLKRRPDVFVFEGGLAKLPAGYVLSEDWKFEFPDRRTIFGCLAETIVLALEGRFESYSVGRGHISLEKMQEIKNIASRHGFGLADFRYGSRVWTKDEINSILSARLALNG